MATIFPEVMVVTPIHHQIPRMTSHSGSSGRSSNIEVLDLTCDDDEDENDNAVVDITPVVRRYEQIDLTGL
jgi:hypothetical protein